MAIFPGSERAEPGSDSEGLPHLDMIFDGIDEVRSWSLPQRHLDSSLKACVSRSSSQLAGGSQPFFFFLKKTVLRSHGRGSLRAEGALRFE